MNKLFHYYSQLTDYDIWLAIRTLANKKNGKSACHVLARSLYRRELPKSYLIEPSAVDYVSDVVTDSHNRHKSKFHDWEFKVVSKMVCFMRGKSMLNITELKLDGRLI